MKTKTDYFTKFITFCVLSLFLITNMILFTSCDNGNSPNDNTNEEQNNNAPTDYCEICDGVQDKNHQHDYCGECDGIQDKNHQHEQGGTENEDGTITETTYPDWFQEEHIGGEDSPYKIMFPVESEYLGAVNSNSDPILQLNSYSDQFKKYIHDLTFSEDFKEKYNTDIAFKTFDNYNSSEESKLHYNKNFDYLIEQINDVCAPVFKEIIKNIKISNYEGISHSNPSFGTEKANERHDKTRFLNLYEAMKNEAYKRGYSTNFESSTGSDTQGKDFYENTKASVTKGWNNAYKNYSLTAPFDIYITENGTEILNPAAVNEFNTMLLNAAEKAGIPLEDAQKIVNLSFVMDPLDAIHDYTSTITQHENNQCPTNEMSDTMNNIDVSLISKAQPKLNKSIFSPDFGRELC